MIFIFQYILAIIVLPFEIFRRRSRVIDILTVFNVVYFICFVIAPIASYYMLIDMQENYKYYNVLYYVTSGHYDFKSTNFYFTGVLSIILYLILIASYSFSYFNFKIEFLERIFTKKIRYKKIYIFALVLLLLSFSALVYSVLTKGFVEWFFSNPRMYFHNTDGESDINTEPWIIDKTFMLAQVAALLFWGLYQKHFDNKLITDNQSLRFLRPLFFLSLGLAALLVFRSSGRLTFFRFIAVFLVGSIYISPRHILRKSLIIAGLGIFVVLYGRSLFRIFLYPEHVMSTFTNTGTELRDSFFAFVSNFTFPFFSASNNLNFLWGDLNYFLDIFKSPFALIPARFIDIDLSSTSAINTARALGRPENSTIPPDILSYALINGSLVGIILVGVSFGMILKLINSYGSKLVSPISAAIFIYLAFNLGFRVMYFDPIHFLSGSLPFLVSMVIYTFLVYKIKLK